jgi:hypothetical protein
MPKLTCEGTFAAGVLSPSPLMTPYTPPHTLVQYVTREKVRGAIVHKVTKPVKNTNMTDCISGL